MNREQLIAAVLRLDQAVFCSKHGKYKLVICSHCLENIHCDECNPIPCQCWNDE